MTAPPSVCVNRSAIAVISHDQRALDAAMRDGWKYLLGTCGKSPEHEWERLVEPRLALIRADFKQKTRGK